MMIPYHLFEQKRNNMNVGVYLDLSDLYHRVHRKFNKKLDFDKLMQNIVDRKLGSDYTFKAYGMQKTNEARGFIACLERLGYETRFKRPEIICCGDREIKKANWELGIAIDILKDKSDVVILGSGSLVMLDLLKLVRCYVLSCDIHPELKKASVDALEIPDEVLE